MELWIPYGDTEIPLRVSDSNFYRILQPAKTDNTKEPAVIIGAALDNPVGDSSLKNAVKPGCTAGVLVDPILPPELRKQSINTLRSRLAELGVSETKVFFRSRLSNVPKADSSSDGDDSLKAFEPSQGSYEELGKTSHGTTVTLQQDLVSCDIRIAVSMAMPHFASGFTGGPEMVLPGSSSIQSIARNRSLILKGSSDPLDVSESPILTDSLEAYKIAGPFYNLAFVPDGHGGIESAFAGELESVFREAKARYLNVHTVKLDRRLDIVVVSAGQLLGMDVYHAVRVLSNVTHSIKRDGTIVLVAECSKGVGDSGFLDLARRFHDRKELATELRYRFKLGGHVNLYLHDILEKYRVELVSVLPDYYVRDAFGLRSARTASDAIQKAVRAEGKDSKILIVTRGDLTLPVFESP